jgi:hypothetical protein
MKQPGIRAPANAAFNVCLGDSQPGFDSFGTPILKPL